MHGVSTVFPCPVQGGVCVCVACYEHYRGALVSRVLCALALAMLRMQLASAATWVSARITTHVAALCTVTATVAAVVLDLGLTPARYLWHTHCVGYHDIAAR